MTVFDSGRLEAHRSWIGRIADRGGGQRSLPQPAAHTDGYLGANNDTVA
jgi:hypothetical protein